MNPCDSLPPKPGTYALVLTAATEISVRVGKLGVLPVEPGYYVYVGSAAGPGGLRARVARHFRESKRVHWHIDYVIPFAGIVDVWHTERSGDVEH